MVVLGNVSEVTREGHAMGEPKTSDQVLKMRAQRAVADDYEVAVHIPHGADEAVEAFVIDEATDTEEHARAEFLLQAQHFAGNDAIEAGG